MTTFFDRYAARMAVLKIDPCSQAAADMFGVTRASLSTWNIKQTTPNGKTVARIADAIGVSADYLLGRTEDPTDLTKPTPDAGSVRQFRIPEEPGIMKLYKRLDEQDRLKAEGVLQGMLMQNKYIDRLNAAHSDAGASPEDAAHDDAVMDDKNF